MSIQILLYMQGYPQLQPVQHGQVVHQQPPHHGERAEGDVHFFNPGPILKKSDVPHKQLSTQPQYNASLNYVMEPKNRLAQQDLTPHGNSSVSDSMERDSMEVDDVDEYDDDDDSPVVDEPDKEIDQFGSLIEEIHGNLGDSLRLGDEFREALKKLKIKILKT
jgi:hypothetical protein